MMMKLLLWMTTNFFDRTCNSLIQSISCFNNRKEVENVERPLREIKLKICFEDHKLKDANCCMVGWWVGGRRRGWGIV